MEGSSLLLSPVAYRLLPVLQFCPILRATDFGWVSRSGHIFDSTSLPGQDSPETGLGLTVQLEQRRLLRLEGPLDRLPNLVRDGLAGSLE